MQVATLRENRTECLHLHRIPSSASSTLSKIFRRAVLRNVSRGNGCCSGQCPDIHAASRPPWEGCAIHNGSQALQAAKQEWRHGVFPQALAGKKRHDASHPKLRLPKVMGDTADAETQLSLHHPKGAGSDLRQAPQTGTTQTLAGRALQPLASKTLQCFKRPAKPVQHSLQNKFEIPFCG